MPQKCLPVLKFQIAPESGMLVFQSLKLITDALRQAKKILVKHIHLTYTYK